MPNHAFAPEVLKFYASDRIVKKEKVERAVIMAEADEMCIEDFLPEKRNRQSEPVIQDGRIDEMEKAAIQRALNKGYKNMDKVAGEVGLSRSTLYRKMKKYGL